MADAVDVKVTRELNSTVAAVWAVMCDLNRLPEWLAFAASVEDVSGDAGTVGSTYTVKPHKSYEPKSTWRVAEVDPGSRQLHTSVMPMISGVTSAIEVKESVDGKTLARVHWRGTPSTFMGRLMRPMFQRRIQQNWERSLESLDRVAAGS
jgi:uncharacterized membrane protein